MSGPAAPRDAGSLPGAVLAALCYAGLFHFNTLVFDGPLRISDQVSWIFLPAAVRMLAVLLVGWAGVLGLFAGALIALAPMLRTDLPHVLMLATLSSVTPLLAARGLQRLLPVRADLHGMTGRQLLYFGLGGAAANSLVQTAYYALRAHSLKPLGGLVPMFVGDIVGTVLMLYLLALMLRHRQLRPH